MLKNLYFLKLSSQIRKLNDFYYEQPALRKNEKPQQLLIMSYPEPISGQGFTDYKKEIYSNVYGK